MKRAVLFAALVFGLLSMHQFVSAQPMPWATSGGWGPDGHYTQLFNPATVETVTGKVASVDEVTPVSTPTRGVRLMLTTQKDETEVSVMLGPSWYVAHQDVRIEPGETVTVTGSKVMIDARPTIIATEVVKGDMVMRLRSRDGKPLWSAWSRRESSR